MLRLLSRIGGNNSEFPVIFIIVICFFDPSLTSPSLFLSLFPSILPNLTSFPHQSHLDSSQPSTFPFTFPSQFLTLPSRCLG